MASTWEEIRLLAADLNRVQLIDNADRLSEANCVEIVSKCIELGLLDVLYSSDGKEYITRDHLRREIELEVHSCGGRSTLVDLAASLNVDLSRIETECATLLLGASDKPQYWLILGQLIHVKYVDQLCDEISVALQLKGKFRLTDVTRSHNLPIEFVNSVLADRVGHAIDAQFDDQEPGVIVTGAYLRRQRVQVRGYVTGLTCSVSLSKIAGELQISSDKILADHLRQLIAIGQIKGQIQGTNYIPSCYAAAQEAWISDFYHQNEYIDYASLKRLAVASPRSYVVNRFTSNVVPLVNFAVSKAALEEIFNLVAVALSTTGKGFIDLAAHLPMSSPFISDLKLIAVAVIQHFVAKVDIWNYVDVDQTSLKPKGRTQKHQKATVDNGEVFVDDSLWDSVLDESSSSLCSVHFDDSCDALFLISPRFETTVTSSFETDVADQAKDKIADYSDLLSAWLARHQSSGLSVGDATKVSDSSEDVCQSKKEERRRRAAKGKSGGGTQGRETKTRSAKRVKGGRKKAQSESSESDNDMLANGPARTVTFMALDQLSELIADRYCESNLQLGTILAEKLAPTLNSQMWNCMTDLYEASQMADKHSRRKAHADLASTCNDLFNQICLLDKGIGVASRKLDLPSPLVGRMHMTLLSEDCVTLLVKMVAFVLDHDNGGKRPNSGASGEEWTVTCENLQKSIGSIVDRATFSSLDDLLTLCITTDQTDAALAGNVAAFINKVPDILRRCLDIQFKRRDRNQDRKTVYERKLSLVAELARLADDGDDQSTTADTLRQMALEVVIIHKVNSIIPLSEETVVRIVEASDLLDGDDLVTFNSGEANASCMHNIVSRIISSNTDTDEV